jgi:hypothetical protein
MHRDGIPRYHEIVDAAVELARISGPSPIDDPTGDIR